VGKKTEEYDETVHEVTFQDGTTIYCKDVDVTKPFPVSVKSGMIKCQAEKMELLRHGSRAWSQTSHHT
jgi:hypothetical protein